MSYKLLFTPELSIKGDPGSSILLTPVIVNNKGGSFAMKKAVTTVKQAFMFDAGFTLAQFIEEEGGVESIQAMLDAQAGSVPVDAEAGYDGDDGVVGD